MPAEREQRLWPHAPRVRPLRLRELPLLVAAACFALGITAARLTLPVVRPTWLLLTAAIALGALTVFALRCVLRCAMLPLAGLWFVAGLWCWHIQPYPPAQRSLLAYADGLSRTIDARVVRVRELPARSTDDNGGVLDADSDPDQWDEPGQPSYSVDLALTAIEDVTPDVSRMVPASGGLRVTVSEQGQGSAPPAPLRCGDVVELPMRLRIPQSYRDPGVFDYGDYLMTQGAEGIAATANVLPSKLRVVGRAAPALSRASLQCRLYAAQTWASARLLAYVRSDENRKLPPWIRLAPEDAATLNAMLFGDRTRLTHQLRLGFERTGSFHLFVVSGMHVALLAGALFWIATRLRMRPWLATLVTLTITTAYALLTGFGVPVRRALLMTAVYLAVRLLFRERLALNALGAAAGAVLVWSPRALFEPSFQMTFLALVAIAGIAAPLAERGLSPRAYAASGLNQRWKDVALPPRLAQLRVMLRLWGELLAPLLGRAGQGGPANVFRGVVWMAELALIGAVAEAVMVLPMAMHFHRATLFALPANMVSIPLVAVIAPFGLATFALSLVAPWLAAIPAAGTALLLHATTGAIHVVSHARAADLRVPGPSLLAASVALVCIALCCCTARRSARWALTAPVLLVCAAVLVLWPSAPRTRAGQLEVTAIDVGQGDSLLVVGPGGRTMLIDAGGPTGAAAHAENASGTAAFDTGEEVVSPVLWSRGIRSLDVVVLSHAHSDHMGGMPAILRNFHPRELWVGVDPASSAYTALLAEAASLGVVVRHLRAPATAAWDDTTVTVLAPDAAYSNNGPPKNNDSLVLRMQYGRASVLLEGDAEAPEERAFLSSGALAPVTLLKVGHHGSRTSTTPELIAASAPQEAIISVGRQNTFGHPRLEILQRLQDAHARVFRTDRFGMTTFLLSPDGSIAAEPYASNR